MEMRSSKKRRAFGVCIQGFSLVELLVVVAVVAVLMAMLLPSLSKARESARIVACQANLRQIMIGSLGYSQDAKGTVPYGSWENAAVIDHTFARMTRKELANNYGLNRAKLWVCPSGVYRDGREINPNFLSDARYTDPTNTYTWTTDNHADRTGYGYFAGPGRAVSGAQYQMPGMFRFADSRDPSRRIVWADALCWGGPGVRFLGTALNYLSGNTHDTHGNAEPVGANSVFTDGHAAWRQYRSGLNVMSMSRQWFIYDVN